MIPYRLFALRRRLPYCTNSESGISCAANLQMTSRIVRKFSLFQGDKTSRWQPQGSCSDGFLEALKCGDTVVAAAAVRVVLALVQNRAIDPDILDSCG